MFSTGDHIRIVVPYGPNSGEQVSRGKVVSTRRCRTDGDVVIVNVNGKVEEHSSIWIRR